MTQPPLVSHSWDGGPASGGAGSTQIGGPAGGKQESLPPPPAADFYTIKSAWNDKPSSPGASSTDTDGEYREAPVVKVPGIAVAMQHSLLKRISAFRTKEELLEFVASYHMLLDPINLVTCLYRLAKMSKESSRGRAGFLAELQRSSTFQLLLRSISSQFLRGHLSFLHHHTDGMKGVDARCLANLIWALAKLDLSNDEHGLTTDLALTVAPFIIRTIHRSSPQGLANMLWSYAKLPVSPPEVIAALMNQITEELRQSLTSDAHKPFDAQALSNSIWALAHLRSRGMDLESLRGANLLAFLEALAQSASRMLLRLQGISSSGALNPSSVADCQRLLTSLEKEFSCQALVNIAWSFATLAGPACASHPHIRQLFLLIHNESIVRLRRTAIVLRSQAGLSYPAVGGFNEQALSNAVYAFDKAGMLSAELLGGVFDVSVLRLQRFHNDANISFKPQELCTLLKACHSNIAAPWAFLATLLHTVSMQPHLVEGWSTIERAELQRAKVLFAQHQMEVEAAMAGGAAGMNNNAVAAAAVAAAAAAAAQVVGSGGMPALSQAALAAAGAGAGAGLLGTGISMPMATRAHLPSPPPPPQQQQQGQSLLTSLPPPPPPPASGSTSGYLVPQQLQQQPRRSSGSSGSRASPRQLQGLTGSSSTLSPQQQMQLQQLQQVAQAQQQQQQQQAAAAAAVAQLQQAQLQLQQQQAAAAATTQWNGFSLLQNGSGSTGGTSGQSMLRW